MIAFGHVGLTLAAAYSLDRMVREPLAKNASAIPNGRLGRLRARLLRPIDYRVVLVGSLLADFIDKPLGLWIAPDVVGNNTRSVAHSAVFAILVLLVAMVASSGWTSRLTVASLATACHMVLDQMWRFEEIALWPLYGWSFPLRDERSLRDISSGYLRQHLEFYKDPWEIAGAVIIAVFLAYLAQRRHYVTFTRSGTLR